MLKLFVVTHKSVCGIPDDRTIIGVGSKEIKDVSLRDDTGDNIAFKNANYCELTALYWMWKNSNADILGLEHYRRFFCERQKNPFRRVKLLSAERMEELLKRYDAIMPDRINFSKSIYDDYKTEHYRADFDLCLEIIRSDYPEYSSDCDAVIYDHKCYVYNMFVMKKSDMDRYCEWLFHILFKVEPLIDLESRTAYQKRVFGFLSERLFNIWIHHETFKIIEMPVYDKDQSPFSAQKNRVIVRLKKIFLHNK